MIDIVASLEGWAAALWRASWQGGLAALAVWFVNWLAPSLPARFQAWLWRLVMLKFVVVLLWSAPLQLPLLPAAPVAKVATWEGSEVLATVDTIERGSAIASPHSVSFISPLLALFIAWVFVVGFQVARLMLDYRAAVRLRNGCRPCEDKKLCAELAKACKSVGLSRSPQLLETAGQGSPLLIGIFRPAIILPETTLSRLSDAERSLVIGHELAHARRGDLFWSLLATIVRALFCFHPLAWLSERHLRWSQEIAADELSITFQKQDPISYATLLVSVISKLGPRQMIPALSVGVEGSQQSLRHRFSAMRFMKPVSRSSLLAYGSVLCLLTVFGVVPWTVVAAQAPTADKVESKETSIAGKFASFKDGVLKIKVKDGPTDVVTEKEWKLADDTKVVSHIRGVAKEGTAREAFRIWEGGAAITVKLKDGKVTFVELGVKQTPDKAPDKGADTTPDRAPDKKADKVPDRVLDKTPNKTPDKVADKPTQKSKLEYGRFESLKNGTLTISTTAGAMLGKQVPENAKTLVWNDDQGKYLPADTAAALHAIKVGTLVVINTNNDDVTVRIGSKKGSVTGTFVSYQNDRLLILGKDLGASFTKKYGNTVHFNKFREDVPAFESVDGGEYKLIGMANKVLGNVKEGAVLTVHAEGDDNITLVQIGVPKQQ